MPVVVCGSETRSKSDLIKAPMILMGNMDFVAVVNGISIY
jgi:hypothetical protein